MSETAREISQEYWRPAQQQQPRPEYPVASVIPYCNTCGTQYAPGARFCHVCGENREPEFHQGTASRIAKALDFTNISQRLGLSATSLVLTALAAGCFLATIFTGVIYSDAKTPLEFELVQMWRMQWMMATIVLLLGAILFRSSSPAPEK